MITIQTIQSTNHLFGIGGLVGIFVTFLLIFDFKNKKKLLGIVRSYGLWIALIATVSSIAGTLLYSEVFGFVPCGLCWLERIALYPQALMLLIALYYKETVVTRYGIGLSAFGLLVSLYHHYLQMGGTHVGHCLTAGQVADCAKRILFEFNFITFPLLAAILFVFLFILYRYIQVTDSTN